MGNCSQKISQINQKYNIYKPRNESYYNQKTIIDQKFPDFSQTKLKKASQTKHTKAIYNGTISSNMNQNVQKLKKKKKSEIVYYNMEDLKILELLGEGGFGKVFRAYDRKTGKLLAIKYFNDPDFDDIRNEDFLMFNVQQINKENRFLQYYGLFKDGLNKTDIDKYMIIMESGESNLSEVLKIRKKYEIPEIVYILKSLVQDLLYLQQNGLATRDIKTENIILIPEEKDSNLFLYKLADFGIGCILEKGINEISIDDLAGCSLKYAAPEIIAIANDKYTEKLTYDPFKGDVYSLGILIIDLFGMTKKDFLNEKIININLKKIILRMIEENVNNRINFQELYDLINQNLNLLYIEQPKNEKKFIQKVIDWKQKDKAIDVKLNEYLDIYLTYYDIGVYKIAGDFLDICYNEIYLPNKNDPKIKDTALLARLFNIMGWFNYDYKEKYIDAEIYYNKSLKIREKVLGVVHLDTAQSYYNLGLYYNYIKKDYKNGELFHIKSKNIREKLVGMNHELTAESYNILALFYLQVRKNYVQAEKYFHISLKIRENVLGFNHELTSQSYNNLGFFYNNVKKDYVQAEELYMKSLLIKEKVLGSNHQSTAQSYNNLGVFYYEIKKDYDKAEEFYLKSLHVREKLFGKKHSNTLESYKNLEIFYRHGRNDIKKADEFKEKIKETNKKKSIITNIRDKIDFLNKNYLQG